MKKIIIFIAALLFSASAFADKGYGKIKWEPIQAGTFVNFLYLNEWNYVFLKGELAKNKFCVSYKTKKIGISTRVFVLYNLNKEEKELKETDLIMPWAIFYYIDLSNKEKIYKAFEDKKMISEVFTNYTKEAVENMESLRTFPKDDEEITTMINILSTIATLKPSDLLEYDKEIKSDAADYAIERRYKYNDDTEAVIIENFIKDYIFVFFVYSEPDY